MSSLTFEGNDILKISSDKITLCMIEGYVVLLSWNSFCELTSFSKCSLIYFFLSILYSIWDN